MLNGKNAIVTGANGGIGSAIVEEFLHQGANVWACMRSGHPGLEADWLRTAREQGVWVKTILFDMADTAQIKDGMKRILGDKFPIDVLVNNAGMVADSASFLMTSIDKMHTVFEVNFFAQMQVTQLAARAMMRKKSGSIVNIASIAALDGTPAELEYVASKAALVGATKKLAKELGIYQIRVNAVAPGVIDTRMGNQIEKALLEETLNGTVMKRLGKPEEIARVAAFLAGDASSFMTGQIVRADGGI